MVKTKVVKTQTGVRYGYYVSNTWTQNYGAHNNERFYDTVEERDAAIAVTEHGYRRVGDYAYNMELVSEPIYSYSSVEEEVPDDVETPWSVDDEDIVI